MVKQNDPEAAADTAAESDTVTYARDPGERPSTSVIRAVAEVTGTAPTRLRPLYDTIDPDALDRTVDSTAARTQSSRNGAVSFRFNDCDVTVYGDGRTVVSPDTES